jgi:hypothetical protein
MSEFQRPLTRAVYEHKLVRAEEAILTFQETGEPTVLWHDEWSEASADYRSIYLTSFERDQAILDVLKLCGIGDAFHQHIKLLKKDSGLRDIVWVNEKTFAAHTPTFSEIFNWLAEWDRLWADEPNDFNVGVALDSPVGLVVVKRRSEEPFTDGDDIEHGTQIALYPKDAFQDIYWYADRYNPRP